MNSIIARLLRSVFPLAVLFLVACGGGYGWSPTLVATYSVGGTLMGLTSGNSITLTNNGTDSLILMTNGSFTFTTKLANAAAYNVAIAGTPPSQSCTLTYGAGTISAANVTSLNVICGLNGGPGTFTGTGSLNTARDVHTATLLPNGQVLVNGGYNSTGILASAELYDPGTGAWTATGSLNTAREYHTATLLPNGRVLVNGGDNSATGYLASAELYDSGTGAWTATGSLVTAREYYPATLLPNGRVLVSGGFNGIALNSAELYW